MPTSARRIAALLLPVFLVLSAHAQSPATSIVNNFSDCMNLTTHTPDCIANLATFPRPTGADGRGQQTLLRNDLSITGPGVSFGNIGFWRVQKINLDFFNTASRGISQDRNVILTKHAVGDTMGTYEYIYSDGGSTALSDEAIKGDVVNVGETDGYFHGTIASTTGPGDIQPTLSFTSGNNWTTDGAPLLDISKGTISGLITGPSVRIANTYLSSLPVDTNLPLSTAMGTCNDPIAYNRQPQVNTPVSCNVTLQMGRFKPGGLVCVTGPNYPEQAPITRADPPANGSQLITLALRNPNQKGAILLQGGLCGQYISFDANLAATGYRSSYYAFGALDPHHLIYGFNMRGRVGEPIPLRSEAEQAGVPGSNGYHLYPGCEVVINRTFGASPVCEPNAVPWAQGDQIEAPHNVAVNVVGRGLAVVQNTPANGSQSSGDLLTFRGYGTTGPSFYGHRTVNQNPRTTYKPFGGLFQAPEFHFIEGYFDAGLAFTTIPGTVVRLYGAPDKTRPVLTLFELPGGRIQWDETTGTLEVPNIAAGNLNTHTPLRATTASIGGSPLALGTCASTDVAIPGATTTMVPVTVASDKGAPGFSPGGAFQVSAQVTAPGTVTVNVCAVIAGTPRPSTYIVALQ
jgi:hypothetical protein